MALAHSTDNYMYGKGRLYFKPEGGNYLDFGNVPSFAPNIELTKSEHYSSRSGVRTKDKDIVTEKKCSASFTLEEFSDDNLNIAFMGDGLVAGSQAAGTLEDVSTAIVDDHYVDLGKTDLFITKLTGAVSDALTPGETLTGGTSSATGKVGYSDDSTYVEVIALSGTFQVGETVTGSSSSETITVTAVETMEDVIVCDDAAGTTRYVMGTDYNVDCVAGLLRVLTSSAATTPVYVSADYEAKTTSSVRALANSECTGELLFVGDPDYGPRWRIQAWDCSLTISGEVGFISDDIGSIAMTAEILADETNHPTEPFFRATQHS